MEKILELLKINKTLSTLLIGSILLILISGGILIKMDTDKALDDLSSNESSEEGSLSEELSSVELSSEELSSEELSSEELSPAGSSGNEYSSEDSLSILSEVSSAVSLSETKEMNDLVQDPSYERGFAVHGLSTIDDKGIRGYFDYDGDQNVRSTSPVWTLAPWYSKYSIGLDHTFTRINDNYYRYEDKSKKVEIDTADSMISLRLDASKEYTEPRQQGEAWPHLLIGQSGRDYSDSPYFDVRKIDDMDEFRVTLDTRLTYFNDAMGDDANPNLHGSGFYIYLYVQNLNRADTDSYGQMIWFGFPLFDNRTAWCPEYGAADGGKEDASGMFIYQIPQNKFMPASFWKDDAPYGDPDNEWIHIDFDCKPYVERALQLAHERNFLKNTTMDELYLNGFNIGWEMYGTYDGEIQVRNFQVVSVYKEQN
ncbi:MAG: hypothetical protein WCR87_05580 [Saccharofermentanales bacterium]